MELNQKIISIYPELAGKVSVLIFESPYVLQDDGSGPYIKEWNYSQPKPTQEQLDAIE